MRVNALVIGRLGLDIYRRRLLGRSGTIVRAGKGHGSSEVFFVLLVYYYNDRGEFYYPIELDGCWILDVG